MAAMGTGLMQNISRSRQTTIYFQRYRQYGDLGDFIEQQISSVTIRTKVNKLFLLSNVRGLQS
jgi:hypothetical protein